MTRLTSRDIDQINDGLVEYDKCLVASTGCGLLDIACHCYGVDVDFIKQQATSFTVSVIPVTAGLGVISHFSDTVAAILSFLGISARVTLEYDVAGLAQAIEEDVDGIFMADDSKFIGVNCNRKKIVDNGDATGKVYAAALSLMAGTISGKDVLVVGCGSVGSSAAEQLLRFGGQVTLIDSVVKKSEELKERLQRKLDLTGRESDRVRIGADLDDALMFHDYILDATPESCLVADSSLTKDKRLAIPGVPPGISEYGFDFLGSRVIHDKLELGVAGMAVGLMI
jgi:3-methylornithyl-N6-L-lysine dehydrogenase